MTQFLTAFVLGLFVGGFITLVVGGLIVARRGDAISQGMRDEEQMEAIAAEAMEKELRLTRQIC